MFLNFILMEPCCNGSLRQILEILHHSVCASSTGFNNASFFFFLTHQWVYHWCYHLNCLSASVAPYSCEQQYHLALNFWKSRRHETFSLWFYFAFLWLHEVEYLMFIGQMSLFFYETTFNSFTQFPISYYLCLTVWQIYMC